MAVPWKKQVRGLMSPFWPGLTRSPHTYATAVSFLSLLPHPLAHPSPSSFSCFHLSTGHLPCEARSQQEADTGQGGLLAYLQHKLGAHTAHGRPLTANHPFYLDYTQLYPL